jgi:3-hydroxyacyl-[acyl-carrier-protein] dehydratase
MDSPQASPSGLNTPMDVVAIQRILPHRYPFLMIDRVIEVERMKRIVAIKNVTVNEPWFHGHFPGHPLMPGVLIIEAMAQAGGVLLLLDVPDRESKLVVFTGIDGAKFRRPVVPGDTVRFEVTVAQWRTRVGKMDGVAYVDDKKVCEATLSCMLVPRTAEDANGSSE